ncbi:uncharacterized protein V6R79_025216 [Siganus canaliculatus]
MAGVYLLIFMAGLLLEAYGLPVATPEENTGVVFVSQQAASMVLRRQRRHNTPFEEILQKDDLERECMEEKCSMEEAREVFKDNQKFMEFWVRYVDGDQCKPPPCQNGGNCQDGIDSYTCWCQPQFSGKNCEIEVYKQCSINNGGCSHFCQMNADQPECHCAMGYRLGSDKRTCEPTEEFSCGRVNLSSTSNTRSIMGPRLLNNFETEYNSSDYMADGIQHDIITEMYDYYDDELTESPDLFNGSHAPGVDIRSMRPNSSSSDDPAEGTTEVAKDTKESPYWAFPTLPTIIAEENNDKRIVGGSEATPGEIPWQVTLMYRTPSQRRAVSFCGGSLISPIWVVTAAHCVAKAKIDNRSFFVRVGEHDVNSDEGPERDHLVVEDILPARYNYNRSPYNHDIALLKLASPVELSNQRRPICLGPQEFSEKLLRESKTSLVSGWGHIRFQGLSAPRLQKLEIEYIERTDCTQSSKFKVTQNMFCAGFENMGKDACQGDSGGPHATNYKGTWFLTGIVSWGEDCAKEGKYGVYTRISRYYGWISKKTGIGITN